VAPPSKDPAAKKRLIRLPRSGPRPESPPCCPRRRSGQVTLAAPFRRRRRLLPAPLPDEDILDSGLISRGLSARPPGGGEGGRCGGTGGVRLPARSPRGASGDFRWPPGSCSGALVTRLLASPALAQCPGGRYGPPEVFLRRDPRIPPGPAIRRKSTGRQILIRRCVKFGPASPGSGGEHLLRPAVKTPGLDSSGGRS